MEQSTLSNLDSVNRALLSLLRERLAESKALDAFDKTFGIAALVARITDDHLLDYIVEVLNGVGYLKTLPLDTLKTNQLLMSMGMPIAARFVSSILFAEALFTVNEFLNKLPGAKQLKMRVTLPVLSIEVKEQELVTNLSDITRFVKNKAIRLQIALYNNKPKVEREKNLELLMSEMAEVDYTYLSDTFAEDIKYLSLRLLAEKHSDNANTKIDDHIFANGGRALFDYLHKEKVRSGADIAYYYRVMYRDNYIIRNQADFREWYHKNYPDRELGKFRTLENLKNVSRENDYRAALNTLNL